MKKDQSERLPSFTEVQAHVFAERGGKVFIGGVEVTPQLRSTLRDEAEYLQHSRLWEILNASLTNEAYDIALRQAVDMELVNFGKSIHHVAHFIRNVIHILAKK